METIINAPGVPVAEPGIAVRADQDEGSIEQVRIGALRLDESNVRKDQPSEQDIAELAGLIASQGLIQNLTAIVYDTPRRDNGVTKTKGRSKKGEFTHGVIAGGRRLRALWLLVQRGRLCADDTVPCRVVPAARALAVSVAENSGREAMSAADTVVAFADMVNSGASVDEIALCFGVSALTVRRRLALANVSPRLFDLYRQGTITLDQLAALALTTDHARQEAAWDSLPPYNRHAASIRRAIAGEAAPQYLVNFVGLNAYRAAGGQVARDLFSGDGEGGIVQDLPLLQKLAVEKLQAIAAPLREGVAWVELMLSWDYADSEQFRAAPTSLREATEAEAAAIAALEAEAERIDTELNALYDSDDEGDEGDGEGEASKQIDALQEQARDIDAKLAEIRDMRSIVAPEVAALAGTVVYINSGGSPCILRNRIKRTDAAKAARVARSATATDDAAAEPISAPALSEALCRSLTAHRTRALQAVMLGQQHTALAALAHPLVTSLLYDGSASWNSPSALGITAHGCDGSMHAAAPDLADSPAQHAIAAAVQRWQAVLPENASDVLRWLLTQPTDALLELLTLCASLTIDAMTARPQDTAADILAETVGLDMADWWQPTGPGYLSRVSKSMIAEAVAEAGMPDEALALAKAKKGEAVERAASLLDGKRWLPAVLRG